MWASCCLAEPPTARTLHPYPKDRSETRGASGLPERFGGSLLLAGRCVEPGGIEATALGRNWACPTASCRPRRAQRIHRNAPHTRAGARSRSPLWCGCRCDADGAAFGRNPSRIPRDAIAAPGRLVLEPHNRRARRSCPRIALRTRVEPLPSRRTMVALRAQQAWPALRPFEKTNPPKARLSTAEPSAVSYLQGAKLRNCGGIAPD